MTCKTTGWCAVGFTTTTDGKNMVNYDIAVGGVSPNMTKYLDTSFYSHLIEVWYMKCGFIPRGGGGGGYSPIYAI